MLDITAAGHLLADETVRDGIREVKEELGINIVMEELIPLGIVSYSAMSENLIDNEIAHVFLYETDHSFDAFSLQKEEVSGIVRIPFSSFFELWSGAIDFVPAAGFRIQRDGSKMKFFDHFSKNQFVQHVPAYFEKVLGGIQNYLERKRQGE